MLALSAKARYGLQAVYDLALHGDESPRLIREIADDQRIPQQFLEQVLVQLKRSLLVRSFRGSHGGYTLARAPENISVIEVLTCLGGPVELDEGPWNDEVLATPFQNAALAVSRALEITLADLVWNKIQSRSNLTYQI